MALNKVVNEFPVLLQKLTSTNDTNYQDYNNHIKINIKPMSESLNFLSL